MFPQQPLKPCCPGSSFLLYIYIFFFHLHKGRESRRQPTDLFGEGHDGAGSDEAALLAAEDGAGARGHARPVRGDQRQALPLVQELLGVLAISLSVFCQARLQTAPERGRKKKILVIQAAPPEGSWFTPEQTPRVEFRAPRFVAQQVLLN